MRLVLSIIIGLALGMPVGAVAAPASPAPDAVRSAMTYMTYDVEATYDLFLLLNQTRLQTGLPALTWDDRLAQAAQSHAELMAERGQLSHAFSDEPELMQRLTAVDLRVRCSGENVGVGEAADTIHTAFLNSPLHRANVLDTDYEAVGIAAVRIGDQLYFVEDFARPLPQVSDSEIAEIVSKKIADLRSTSDFQLSREINNTRVQELARSMAQNDTLSNSGGSSLPGARLSVAFTTDSPDKLPAGLERLQSVQDVDRYAVGTCFARTSKHPNGAYWVLLVLFSPNQSVSAGM